MVLPGIPFIEATDEVVNPLPLICSVMGETALM
jgi:hypothetical protein